jgi:hypothetical protein
MLHAHRGPKLCDYFEETKANMNKNVHICSMCIKTNQVGKQEVGI